MQLTQSQTQIGTDVYLWKCLTLSLRHTLYKGGQILTQVVTDSEALRPPETIKQYTLLSVRLKIAPYHPKFSSSIWPCINRTNISATESFESKCFIVDFIECLIKQSYTVRFRKSAQTKRLLAVILSTNISFLAHFPHFSVLISLFLAESEGGWKSIGRPVKGMWGHNSRRPPLSASQPPHKAEIKLGPGTQTETSIFPDPPQIERKRRPKNGETNWLSI